MGGIIIHTQVQFSDRRPLKDVQNILYFPLWPRQCDEFYILSQLLGHKFNFESKIFSRRRELIFKSPPSSLMYT